MTDKLIDIFYYFIPGSIYIMANIFLFPNKIKELNITDGLSVVIFIISSLFVGLFFEGISKFWIDKCYLIDNDDRKGEIHFINRRIFYEKRRDLPEYFSSRASFYRNSLIPLLLIILSIIASDKILYKNFTVSIVLVIFAISMKLYCVNAYREMNTLYDYYKENEKLDSYK